MRATLRLMAEVDGNRTRLSRIARANRLKGGRASDCFPWSEDSMRGRGLLAPRRCPARRSFTPTSFGFHRGPVAAFEWGRLLKCVVARPDK
jgi:hypothetical protein